MHGNGFRVCRDRTRHDGAAARRLTLKGRRVALVDKEEPADRLAHQGDFASQHGAARKLECIAVRRMPGREVAPATSGGRIVSLSHVTYPHVGFTSAPEVALPQSDFAEELRPVLL